MLRGFSNTRVLIDFEAFENDLSEGVLVCTNLGVLNAIRVLVRSYGLREANWVTAYSNAGYIGPSAEQFDIIDSEISAFLGDTDDMTFCEDLVNAFNNLSASFQAGCCGNGSFGAGQNEPAASTQVDSEGDFPPEFDTYAEYRAYKCDVANRIIEGIREDMEWLAAGTLVTLVASGLVASLFTPIPFDDILLLVGFVVSLLLQGVLAGTALAVDTTIDTERQTLVCLLYDATDATDAKTIVTSYMASLLTATEMALFASVWTFASVNALFGKDLLLEASPLPDAVSCAGCTSECELCVVSDANPSQHGVFTIISETVITVVSGIEPGIPLYWAICEFNTKAGPFPQFYCGPAVKLVSYDLVGFTDGPNSYRVYDETRTLIYNESFPPDWSTIDQVRTIQLVSLTPFTGTITLV